MRTHLNPIYHQISPDMVALSKKSFGIKTKLSRKKCEAT